MTTLRSGQPVSASLVESRAFGDLSDAPAAVAGAYLGWNGSGVLSAVTPHTTEVPSYGGAYEFNEAGSAISMASKLAYYQWVSGVAGTLKGTGYVTWDTGSKALVVGANGAGVYQVNCIFSGSFATANCDIEAVIFKGTTAQDNLRSDQFVPTNATYQTGAITGLITLAAADTISLRFGASEDTRTWSVKHINLTIIRIG